MTIEETIKAAVRDAMREALADLRALAQPTAPAAATTGPRYLTSEAAAEIAGVKPGTIRRWLGSGRLPTHHAGRMLRVRLDELQAFMAAGEASDEPTDDEVDARAFAIVHGKR